MKTVGSSADPLEVASLVAEGKKWISAHLGQQDMFELVDQEQSEKLAVENVFSNIENILFNGTQLIGLWNWPMKQLQIPL